MERDSGIRALLTILIVLAAAVLALLLLGALFMAAMMAGMMGGGMMGLGVATGSTTAIFGAGFLAAAVLVGIVLLVLWALRRGQRT